MPCETDRLAHTQPHSRIAWIISHARHSCIAVFGAQSITRVMKSADLHALQTQSARKGKTTASCMPKIQ